MKKQGPGTNDFHKPVVLHFVSGGGSGATRVAMNLVEGHLSNDRIEPVLVLRVKPQASPDYWIERAKEKGIRCYCFRKGFNFLTYLNFRRVLQKVRPDVVVAHGYSEHIWGRLAAIHEKVPLIFQVEHNLENYSWWKLRLSRWLQGRTRKIICVSFGVRDNLRSKGLNSDKLQVIYNGIDVERSRSGQDKPWSERRQCLVMTARFSHQKDHVTLVRAIGELKKRGTNLPTLLIGGGNKLRMLKAKLLIQMLGVSETVELCGFRRDVPMILGNCRYFVLSSIFEGFGLVVAEAMAAGCTVIASDAPGIRELIRHGENGLLFPVGDYKALACLLEQVINDPEWAMKLAGNGKHCTLNNFNLDRMVHDYENIILQAYACDN